MPRFWTLVGSSLLVCRTESSRVDAGEGFSSRTLPGESRPHKEQDMDDKAKKKAESVFGSCSERLESYGDKYAAVLDACGSDLALALAGIRCGLDPVEKPKKKPASKKKK